MNKFKDACNRWLTSGLFYEARQQEVKFSLYTLGEEDRVVDGKKLLAIKHLFVACDDPTEYEFANKYLGGWSHWKEVQASEALKPYIATWREEQEIRLRANAIKQIASLATSEKGYQAAKFIADKGWKVRTAGAPSKDEVEGMKAVEKVINKEFTSDAERLGLVRLVK